MAANQILAWGVSFLCGGLIALAIGEHKQLQSAKAENTALREQVRLHSPPQLASKVSDPKHGQPEPDYSKELLRLRGEVTLLRKGLQELQSHQDAPVVQNASMNGQNHELVTDALTSRLAEVQTNLLAAKERLAQWEIALSVPKEVVEGIDEQASRDEDGRYRPYFEAKREYDELLMFRRALCNKLEMERADAALPVTTPGGQK